MPCAAVPRKMCCVSTNFDKFWQTAQQTNFDKFAVCRSLWTSPRCPRATWPSGSPSSSWRKGTTLCTRSWPTLTSPSPPATRSSDSPQVTTTLRYSILLQTGNYYPALPSSTLLCPYSALQYSTLLRSSIQPHSTVLYSCLLYSTAYSSLGRCSRGICWKQTVHSLHLFVIGLCCVYAGPRSRGTHWKQTVLYLEETVAMCEGEVMTGHLSVKPNEKNPRDLDLRLEYQFSGRRANVSNARNYRMR